METTFRPTIGMDSIHENTNDNGSRLIFFAASQNMVIGTTLFLHKEIHKRAWSSPDSNTYNQIDHILIDSRHKSNIKDVRSYRGANIDSDHYPVMSHIREHL
jgi:endonuclease/exonuclease/phosphatase family metal-dependent hydrolase